MNRILILEELETCVYIKCLGLYSILYDGWRRIILELFGRGRELFWRKNILKKIGNRTPLCRVMCMKFTEHLFLIWLALLITNLDL